MAGPPPPRLPRKPPLTSATSLATHRSRPCPAHHLSARTPRLTRRRPNAGAFVTLSARRGQARQRTQRQRQQPERYCGISCVIALSLEVVQLSQGDSSAEAPPSVTKKASGAAANTCRPVQVVGHHGIASATASASDRPWRSRLRPWQVLGPPGQRRPPPWALAGSSQRWHLRRQPGSPAAPHHQDIAIAIQPSEPRGPASRPPEPAPFWT
jgi:hypothetical protein